MSVRTTMAKGSEEYLLLLNYMLEQPDGTLMRYRIVEDVTGVEMDPRGKAKLRRAILRARREYSVIRSVGYKLAEPQMVMGILSFRLLRIDGAVKRADRAQAVLQSSFFDSLTPEQQRGVLFVGSIFGAIRLAAESGRRLYKPLPPPELPLSATLRVPGDPL